MKVNPLLTQNFVSSIEQKALEGAYRINVAIEDKLVPIDVYPGVFPPHSDYSVSSRSVYERFGDLEDQEVADIGCGSGIESLVAALAGAAHVDATDISATAVDCSRHNIEQNNLQEKVSVYQGDLFSGLPEKRYDLIIANLPIVDFRPVQESEVTAALYDPDFEMHKRLLSDAKDRLTDRGVITFTHANLQSGKTEESDRDFEILEDIIEKYGYEVVERTEREDLGYKWINYKIALHKGE